MWFRSIVAGAGLFPAGSGGAGRGETLPCVAHRGFLRRAVLAYGRARGTRPRLEDLLAHAGGGGHSARIHLDDLRPGRGQPSPSPRPRAMPTRVARRWAMRMPCCFLPWSRRRTAGALDLSLEMFFAVCKDICIPATATASIALGTAMRDPERQRARRIVARGPSRPGCRRRLRPRGDGGGEARAAAGPHGTARGHLRGNPDLGLFPRAGVLR